MPMDVYAALGALVRAEIARVHAQPTESSVPKATAHTDQATPHPDRTATPAPAPGAPSAPPAASAPPATEEASAAPLSPRRSLSLVWSRIGAIFGQ